MNENVIPVKLVLEGINRGTGIQNPWKTWVPAFAGTTSNRTLNGNKQARKLFADRKRV